ncbi:MAG: YraN family protein [Clostridiales bacterium]|nr:YraN family protein [Clostridiales bacterium]
MNGNTRREGVGGEVLAAEYLKSIGYKILDTNFSGCGGEIDIIARDGDYIVFVEVKARQSLKFGRPIESVTPSKTKSIARAAELYAASKSLFGKDMRFDVIEILRGEITHIKNAFDAC